jgi:hypothetical protein
MANGCTSCDDTGKVLVSKTVEQFCAYCGGTGTVMSDTAQPRVFMAINGGRSSSSVRCAEVEEGRLAEPSCRSSVMPAMAEGKSVR